MMGVYVEGLTGFQCNRFLIHLSDMTTDIVASGNGNKMPSSRGVGRLDETRKAHVSNGSFGVTVEKQGRSVEKRILLRRKIINTSGPAMRFFESPAHQ